MLRRGNAICALGPQNRNAVRLETLGIHPEEIPILQDGLNQSSFAPAKDFLIEKRKYMDWLEHRRQKNAKRAEDALADVAALITSLHPGKEDFRELQSLLKQTIYLERDLHTEGQTDGLDGKRGEHPLKPPPRRLSTGAICGFFSLFFPKSLYTAKKLC